MTAEDFVVYRNLALCFSIVAILVFLAVVLCREWVRSDLRQKICQPIYIRWRPLAWRTNWLTCSFRVLYSDVHGQIHRRICWTYWLRPNVTWDRDEIIDHRRETVALQAAPNERLAVACRSVIPAWRICGITPLYFRRSSVIFVVMRRLPFSRLELWPLTESPQIRSWFMLGIVSLFLFVGCVQPRTQPVRLVVTGRSADGKAMFVQNGAPPEVLTFDSLPGFELVPLWSTAIDQMIPAPGEDPSTFIESFVPGPGETRFLLFRLPSQAKIAAAIEAGSSAEAFQEEYAAKVPTLASAIDLDNPTLHITDTVDYVVVLSGEIVLELDDGAQVRLKPGDVVVQNGTPHAWLNVGEEDAVLAAVMIGARRDD